MILNIAVVFFVCFTGYVNGFTMFKLKTSSEFSIEKTITRIGKPYSYQSMVNSKSQPYTNILKMSNNENSSNNNNNSGIREAPGLQLPLDEPHLGICRKSGRNRGDS